MAVQAGKKIPDYLKSPKQATKERKQKARAKFGRNVKKAVTKGVLDPKKRLLKKQLQLPRKWLKAQVQESPVLHLKLLNLQLVNLGR